MRELGRSSSCVQLEASVHAGQHCGFPTESGTFASHAQYGFYSRVRCNRSSRDVTRDVRHRLRCVKTEVKSENPVQLEQRQQQGTDPQHCHQNGVAQPISANGRAQLSLLPDCCRHRAGEKEFNTLKLFSDSRMNLFIRGQNCAFRKAYCW